MAAPAPVTMEELKARSEANPVGLAELAKRNAFLTDEVEGIYPTALGPPFAHLIFPVDFGLAMHFPIVGAGAESVVFDIGTCVLKRSCGTAGIAKRGEAQMRKVAESRPGLYCEPVEIRLGGVSGCRLRAQQKLQPVKAAEYAQRIRDIYFPDVVGFLKLPDFQVWEWGLDELGVPHVFNWA